MIIRFMLEDTKAEQKDRKQLLIGKFWRQEVGSHNVLNGKIGIKKKNKDWDFSDVTLHPGDKIYIKRNRYYTAAPQPEFLLYVENTPFGVKRN